MQDLTKFNPTVTELNALVEASKDVTVTDIHNTTEMNVVKEHRTKIVKARTAIQAVGKDYRADALALQKAVIAKEKELIGIIAPEEERLKKIESDAKLALEREDRVKILPERREKLKMAGLPDQTDDFLLDMDNVAFSVWYADTLQEKMEADNSEKIKKEEAKEVIAETEKAISKNKAYKDFLAKHEYNKVTDKLVETDKDIKLYRVVATLKK